MGSWFNHLNQQPPDGYREVARVSCPKLIYNVPGVFYSCLEVEDPEEFTSLVGSFTDVSLKYIVKDCDPNTGIVDDDVGWEYIYHWYFATLASLIKVFQWTRFFFFRRCENWFSWAWIDLEKLIQFFSAVWCLPLESSLFRKNRYNDEYALEDVDLNVSDFMSRMIKSDFISAWDDLDPELEVEETYGLSNFKTIEEAVKNVVGFLGLQPCDRSDRVKTTDGGKTVHSHTLYLAGVFKGSTEVLVSAKLAIDAKNPDSGVILKLSVKSKDENVSNFVASAVQWWWHEGMNDLMSLLIIKMVN